MILRLVIATVLLLGETSISDARPMLDHASPAPGSTVGRAPSRIALSFTERLSAAGSDAVVRDASGAVVSSGKAKVVGDNAQMQVPVNSLPPGKYRVEWYVVSADKHQNQGSFRFGVGGKETLGQGQSPIHRRPQKSRQLRSSATTR